MKHKARGSRKALYIIFVIALLMSVFSTKAFANKAQKHICKAGLSLGQAEARVYLFGRSFTGPIPAEQVTAIASNLANASAEITAAEALFGEPFNSERSRNGIAASVISKISGFGSKASGSSYQQQASYIRSVAGVYRSSLAITFVSSRPDAFQKNENCDSILFNLCYNYGRATIGSSFDPGWEYKGSGSLIPQLIRDGLAVAMDPGHKPFDGHHKKICCTFGSPAAWSAFPSFRGTSPYSLYSSSQSTLQGIIGSANALDSVCGSGDKYICASSAVRQGSGGKFAGNWRCKYSDSNEGTIRFNQNANRVTMYDPKMVKTYVANIVNNVLHFDFPSSESELGLRSKLRFILKSGGSKMEIHWNIYQGSKDLTKEMGAYVYNPYICTRLSN